MIYEAWNTKLQRRILYTAAPDLEVAIQEARNICKLHPDVAQTDPDDLFVCAAVPENISARARAAVDRFGETFIVP